MTNFKDADAKPRAERHIGLRGMTDADWNNYVLHVVGAGELFMQYGCEPTEELMRAIRTITPDVVYYAVYLNEENVMAGYVGVTPAKGRQKSRRKPSRRISHRFGCLKSSGFKRRLSDSGCCLRKKARMVR